MKDLQTALARYAVPPPGPHAVADAVAAAQSAAAVCPPRMRNAIFLRQQLGFISPRMWALQGLFALVLGAWALGQGAALHWLCPAFSAAAPLLVLINITDWVRVYNGGMLELELATRFSLPGVAAARMLIFGLSDAALLLALSAFAAAATRSGLLVLLVRMLVPFNAMCAGCLWLLRKTAPGRFVMGAVLLAAVLTAAMVLAHGRWRPGMCCPSCPS